MVGAHLIDDNHDSQFWGCGLFGGSCLKTVGEEHSYEKKLLITPARFIRFILDYSYQIHSLQQNSQIGANFQFER